MNMACMKVSLHNRTLKFVQTMNLHSHFRLPMRTCLLQFYMEFIINSKNWKYLNYNCLKISSIQYDERIIINQRSLQIIKDVFKSKLLRAFFYKCMLNWFTPKLNCCSLLTNKLTININAHYDINHVNVIVVHERGREQYIKFSKPCLYWYKLFKYAWYLVIYSLAWYAYIYIYCYVNKGEG